MISSMHKSNHSKVTDTKSNRLTVISNDTIIANRWVTHVSDDVMSEPPSHALKAGSCKPARLVRTCTPFRGVNDRLGALPDGVGTNVLPSAVLAGDGIVVGDTTRLVSGRLVVHLRGGRLLVLGFGRRWLVVVVVDGGRVVVVARRGRRHLRNGVGLLVFSCTGKSKAKISKTGSNSGYYWRWYILKIIYKSIFIGGWNKNEAIAVVIDRVYCQAASSPVCVT